MSARDEKSGSTEQVNPEEEELRPVGPGADEEPEEEVRQATDESEDSPDEDDDERVGHVDQDDESTQEHVRTKRAEQRRKKRERVQKELNFLRYRNEQLERQQSAQMAQLENRQTQTEILAIDGRIQELEGQIRQAEDVHTQANAKGAHDDATEALRLRDQFKDGLAQLKATRQQVVAQANQRTQAQQRPQVDPQIQQRAREWANENSDWFTPERPNEATHIAFAVEQQLMQEGRLDARTDAYYAELDRRLKRRLPEVYRDDPDDEEEEPRRSNQQNRERNGTNRRPTGPVFRTGGRERTLRKGEVYIDADRRKAMEEMGVWEDPVLRRRYLDSFQRYDREHGRTRQ